MLGGEATPNKLERISRRHAIITFLEGKYFYLRTVTARERRARNNTFINEEAACLSGTPSAPKQ